MTCDENGQGVPLENCIVDMVSSGDFCLFLTEEGILYALGTNIRGMMGLGKETINTGSMAKRVNIK